LISDFGFAHAIQQGRERGEKMMLEWLTNSNLIRKADSNSMLGRLGIFGEVSPVIRPTMNLMGDHWIGGLFVVGGATGVSSTRLA
jgi:hypothetical protein